MRGSDYVLSDSSSFDPNLGSTQNWHRMDRKPWPPLFVAGRTCIRPATHSAFRDASSRGYLRWNPGVIKITQTCDSSD